MNIKINQHLTSDHEPTSHSGGQASCLHFLCILGRLVWLQSDEVTFTFPVDVSVIQETFRYCSPVPQEVEQLLHWDETHLQNINLSI